MKTTEVFPEIFLTHWFQVMVTRAELSLQQKWITQIIEGNKIIADCGIKGPRLCPACLQ